MPGVMAEQPPKVAGFLELYRFISPELFQEMGIDPEDVPLGTFPAEDHPPFLPDRFGGNAYGLGLYEQGVLSPEQERLLESLDLSDPRQIAENYRKINNIFKRLGLLIRYSGRGTPFYLIPRQYVAHHLGEIQARTDEIAGFLSGILGRRLRETLKVGLAATEYELLLPELQARMPQVDFVVLDSLDSLTSPAGPFAALVAAGDLMELGRGRSRRSDWRPPRDRDEREAFGYFLASRLYGMLEDDGGLMILADRPLSGSRKQMTVRFAASSDYKRFLMFSHVFRTRRRYRSGPEPVLTVNRFDFHSFLTGMGIYHETVESMLDGRTLAQVEPKEIDALPRQDLTLPRGSEERMTRAWRRCLSPFFHVVRQEAILTEVQRRQWKERYLTDGPFPATLLVMEGRRKRAPVTLEKVEAAITRRRMAGCDRGLLAGYKDSFAYVGKVLDILGRIREGRLEGMPGLELSRLRKPFERQARRGQLADILELMKQSRRLARLEGRLNPGGVMGPQTPVLANLDKLALLGMEEGPLRQLYLIVVGHSTMTRVTFGKLPETALKPLTDLERYTDLDEAISTIRLYRLLSVAEAAAASPRGMGPGQVTELFNLYDDAIRVVTNPDLDWSDVLDAQIAQLGGVQAKAARKMLKLFDLFEFLENQRELEMAGPRQKEAMAGYDPKTLARIQQVVELSRQMRRFISGFFPGNSTSRPYFFRAFLNCELHGTGRLLPSLGVEAGFTLLWICMHVSERRLLNFNPLLEVESADDLSARLEKLTRALVGLEPRDLSPHWLASLRGDLEKKGEIYIRDSGLYLTLDQKTGALTPRFVDVDQELERLRVEVDDALSGTLAQVPNHRLHAMDRRLNEVGRFTAAQGPAPEGSRRNDAERVLAGMSRRQAQLSRRLESWLLQELFDLEGFASSLGRLLENCPHLMDRLLPDPRSDPRTARRLSAAQKLSALKRQSLDQFQDMQRSHEAARMEFGPTAAGIVGVSPLQFQALTASLAQLLAGRRGLARVLMLAVLLHGRDPRQPEGDSLRDSPLTRAVGLDRRQRRDLRFLLEHYDLFWRIARGEESLQCLADLTDAGDPPLVEALLILAAAATAARREGLLTEDFMESYFSLHRRVRGLLGRGESGGLLFQEDLEEHARHYIAFQRYQEIQREEAPIASLRQLLETTPLPDDKREYWLDQGALRVGVDRVLRLKRLMFVNWLDVELLRQQAPVNFIYRMKGLRSIGPIHFERDLFEGLRLYRGFSSLEPEHQRFLLLSLAGAERPLAIRGFARAAERLTYTNQIRLLLLGLAAALRLDLGPSRPLTLSFLPLARVMERKFELVNQAITALKPSDILARPSRLKRRLSTRGGFVAQYDAQSRVLTLNITEPVHMNRKLQALRQASDVTQLKNRYHRELKELKHTHYHTLDFQERLEAAFKEALARLGEEMMEEARRRMGAETDLERLEAIYRRAWDDGLALPLAQDRLQSLRDLFEMNVERLRRAMLTDLAGLMDAARTLEELDELWEDVKKRLQAQRRYLGRDFDFMVAGLFDRRAQELKVRRPPTA